MGGLNSRQEVESSGGEATSKSWVTGAVGVMPSVVPTGLFCPKFMVFPKEVVPPPNIFLTCWPSLSLIYRQDLL